MIQLGLAFALWLHGLFWGAGLASLITPRRWRAFWPVWMPLCGWTLQSSAVWAGAYLLKGGTNAHGWWLELLPLLLLIIALLRHGPLRWLRTLGRFWGLWLLGALSLCLLVLPISLSTKGLSSVSLGSLDAADYAQGARVLQDFDRHERLGFLGQTEVVRVMSADNVPDFWLRLNHFTPSALMAQHGSILGSRPHQLATLFTASLLAASLPLVFWMARALFRLGRRSSLGIAALFGVNPLAWYAVAHVAPAQMLAAQGITALGIAGVLAWRRSATGWRAAWSCWGLLTVALGLLLGSYNFILLVAFAPLAGTILLYNLPRPQFGRLLGWLGMLLTALLAAGLFNWDRVAGLVERFTLFQEYDFGWKIPSQSPAGWLGMVSDTELHGLPLVPRLLMAMLVIVLAASSYLRESERRSFRPLLGLAFFAPPMLGYLFLEVRGELLHTNASYDAYKLLSVFYPGILCTLAFPLLLLRAEKPYRLLTWPAVVLVFCLNLWGASLFMERLANPPFRVTQSLVDLRHIDHNPKIGSINLLIPEFWDRLWANAFLLRHRQHFLSHSYEGRLPGPLKGEWDLSSSLAYLKMPDENDTLRVGQHFTLNRVSARNFIRVWAGRGWNEIEGRGANRWVWSDGEGTIILENPHPYPVRLEGSMLVRTCSDRVLSIELDFDYLNVVKVGPLPRSRNIPPFNLPPGRSTLVLRTTDPRLDVPKGETRKLGVCLYKLELRPCDEDAETKPDKALASP
jgi:hypothetical protein